MAQASKRLKRARKLKRSNTLLHRGIRATQAEGIKALSILFTVLAQKGGEVVVTKGTVDQVHENLRHLSYLLDKTSNEDEFVVRLVEGKVNFEAKSVPHETELKLPGMDTPIIDEQADLVLERGIVAFDELAPALTDTQLEYIHSRIEERNK